MYIYNIYIYIYIRLEDKLELLHMNFISLHTNLFRMTRRVLPHSSGECGKTRLVIRNKFVVK